MWCLLWIKIAFNIFLYYICIMKYIGNILANKDISFDERIKTVTSANDIIDGVPLLIIDYSLAKSLYPEDIDILNTKVNDSLFWCESMIENRNNYEICTEDFIQYCYEQSISDIKYLYVDPIQQSLHNIKRIIGKINSLTNPVYFIYRDMVYLYGDGIIFGIDLHFCEFYLNIKKEKIKNKLNSLKNSILLDNEILIEYKEYLGRLNTAKYIPYLYSMDKNE